MIQGGDPEVQAGVAKSIWGGKFEGGRLNKSISLCGCSCLCNSRGTSTNGSQFYIVTGEKQTDASRRYQKSIIQNYGRKPILMS